MNPLYNCFSIMLQPDSLSKIVDLQQRSFLLLKWLADAIGEGFIRFETAHDYSSMPAAGEAWIREHYLNLPERLRPEQEDVGVFSAIFSTYLKNSFDLHADPGKRLYSEDAHCFCRFCSWMIGVPRLQPKKLKPADKKRAQTMIADTLRRMASQHELEISDRKYDEVLANPDLREALAMTTYGYDLLRRAQGAPSGPAVLHLWRSFAWVLGGGPKKKFRLNAVDICAAEQQIFQALSDDASQFGIPAKRVASRFTDADRELFEFLIEAALDHYGDRLQTIKLVGSRARGTAKPESDYDFLLFLDQCDYDVEVPALHKMGDRLTEQTGLGPLSISPMTREQFVGLDAKFDNICSNFRRDAVALW